MRGGRTPARPRSADELAGRIVGPAWAQVEGFEVRTSRQDSKRYRCPYCEGWIEPGTLHLVVFPSARPEDRRHYHSPCWAKASGRRRS